MSEKTPVLPILALIFAILIFPVGFILSIIALVRVSKTPEKKGLYLSIAALIISLIMPFFIMLMLGPLLYFRVINPEGLLPDRCKFSKPFLCTQDYKILAQGEGTGELPTIKAEIINKYNKNVKIKNLQVYNEKACNDYYACIDSDNDGTCSKEKNLKHNGAFLYKGSRQTLIVDCKRGELFANEPKTRIGFNFTWHPAGENYSRNGLGKIVSKAK